MVDGVVVFTTFKRSIIKKMIDYDGASCIVFCNCFAISYFTRPKLNFVYYMSLIGNPGRFPFTKRFRKFRLGCKWNMLFWFVPLENLRKKWNFGKGGLVFPLETFSMELRVPFTSFTRFDQFQAVHDHIFGDEIWRNSSTPSIGDFRLLE